MLQKLWPSARSKQNDGSKSNIQVIVNVYDMLPSHWLVNAGHTVGIGAYHSGVELLGREFCYGGHDRDLSGVFVVNPRVGPPGVVFKVAIPMGSATGGEEDVGAIIRTMADEFRGNQYHLLMRNCNHFTAELVLRLTGRSPPGWINRAARLGTMFPCVLPQDWISPPDLEAEDSVHPTASSQHQHGGQGSRSLPPRPASMVAASLS